MSDSLTLASVHPVRERPRVPARPFAAVGPLAAGAGVAVATSAAYLLTMARDLYSLDSPELTAAAHRLGIAHAPGYPLYTLVGWLFSHAFPIGNVAFRLNLLSAAFGVAGVLLVYALGLRLTQRPLVAAAGALSLAFSYWFWADSLAAEVYTLDVALFAGVLLAALAWRARIAWDARAATVFAALAGLLLGLGLATRTTAVLYAPALFAFAWIAGERSPKSYLAAVGGIAAGSLFYLYLPLRSAAGVDVGPGAYTLAGDLRVYDLATWDGFWRHVLASDFRADVFTYGPIGALREAGEFAGMLAASFIAIGVPLGVAGGVRLWRRDRALLLLLAGTTAPLALFFINYGAIDKEFMFLPVYAAWALLTVAGIDWAIEAAAAREGALRDGVALAAVSLVLPAVALAINAPLVSLAGEDRVRDESELFLSQVKDGAIVYGPFLDSAPFQYLQAVEGQRPDVKLVNSWTVDDDGEFLVALAGANVGKTPVYVTQDEPALRGRYRLVRVGERGYEVLPR